MTLLAPALAALLTLMAGDLLWLGVLMRGFYQAHAGHLMSDHPQWAAAALFYLLYTAGILYFAVLPHTSKGLPAVALNGFLLGLLVYGVYDLTNLAILKNWPTLLSVVDILWGAALTTAVATAAHLALQHFGK